jgi:hypothetical protein
VSDRLAELVLPTFTPAVEAQARSLPTPKASGRELARTSPRRVRRRAPASAATRPAATPARPNASGPHTSLWSIEPDAAELWAAWSACKLASVEPRIRHKVFFEPDNPIWRFLLGAVLWERGWLRRARREIERAEALLAEAPADAAVSGLCSAAELRRVIEEWSVQHG